MAVLFIDVDDFKHYNDQYSHATGDQVLKFVARTIKGTVNEFGFAGRYGGDEFIACIRNAEINDPTRAAQDIISKLEEGFECDGVHLDVYKRQVHMSNESSVVQSHSIISPLAPSPPKNPNVADVPNASSHSLR